MRKPHSLRLVFALAGVLALAAQTGSSTPVLFDSTGWANGNLSRRICLVRANPPDHVLDLAGHEFSKNCTNGVCVIDLTAGEYLWRFDGATAWALIRVPDTEDLQLAKNLRCEIPRETPGNSVPAVTNPDDFSIILLPDTQYYSSSYPEVLTNAAMWITNNMATLNIKASVGLGDIVDNAADAKQWPRAMFLLDCIDKAGIPNVNPPGNHDYNEGDRTLLSYNTNIPLSRYNSKPWFGGSFDGKNSENLWIKLDVGKRKLLIMALEFGPRLSVLQWAENVISTNQDREVLITTHSHLFMGNLLMGCAVKAAAPSRYYNDATDGIGVWNTLIRKFPNIVIVVNGHSGFNPGQGVARLQATSDKGTPVMQMLSDYQFLGAQRMGDGFLRVLRFHADSDRVDVYTYSPFKNASLRDSDNEFSFKLK